jgi:hypothetical protein
MKLEFLACPMEERRLFLEQAAIRRGLSPVILEKDFLGLLAAGTALRVRV